MYGVARHEAMAIGNVARFHTGNFKRHHLAIKAAQDRMQRAHPTQIPRPPAHSFGPRKFVNGLGNNLGNDFAGRPAFNLAPGHIKRSLGPFFNHRFVHRGQPRRFQKAGNRLFRRANFRPFALFHAVLLRGSQSGDDQRQAARGGKGFGAAWGIARLQQPPLHQFQQIRRRSVLHAGGNFFGEYFQ